LSIRLTANTADWMPATSITVTVHAPNGTAAGSRAFDRNAQGSSFSVQVQEKGFHAVTVEAANTPTKNSQPSYVLAALLIVAAWGMVALDPETPSWKIFAVLMLLGAGGGLFAPANSRALLAAVSTECYGLATSILATARNLGMAFGVGGAALLYFEFGGRTSALATLQAVRPAFAVIACSAILYAILATQWDPRRNERQARLAQPVKL
jgi:MFS family permease